MRLIACSAAFAGADGLQEGSGACRRNPDTQQKNATPRGANRFDLPGKSALDLFRPVFSSSHRLESTVHSIASYEAKKNYGSAG
jgi:hypothetical protein